MRDLAGARGLRVDETRASSPTVCVLVLPRERSSPECRATRLVRRAVKAESTLVESLVRGADPGLKSRDLGSPKLAHHAYVMRELRALPALSAEA